MISDWIVSRFSTLRLLACLAGIWLSVPAVAQQIYINPPVSEPLEPYLTVDVVIATAGLDVMGMEIEIAFDPTVVALDHIEPGEWVTSAGLDYFFYDLTTPGTDVIRFDMAFLGTGRTGDGQVAICHFHAASPGTSPLEFGTLDIRDPDNAQLTFTHSEGDQIHVRSGYIYVFPPLTVPATENFTVDIAIQSPGQEVKGMSIELSYDPAVVALDHIAPGSWVTSSGLGYYFYDHTSTVPAGEIFFDMAFLDDALAGSGQVAICHFTALMVGESPLVFEVVDVRDADNSPLAFTHSEGDLILIDDPIAADQKTFGAVKALYR